MHGIAQVMGPAWPPAVCGAGNTCSPPGTPAKHLVTPADHLQPPAVIVQATPAQQAELQKMKGLQEKLGAELGGLSQRVADLQGQSHKYEGVDGAKNQVRHFVSQYNVRA